MSFFTRIIVVAVALGMVASGRPVHKPKHAHTAIATDAADSLPVDVATSTGVITLTASSTEDGVSFAPTPVSSTSKGLADIICPGCGVNRDNQTFTV